jgi:hypothetical protein
MARASGGTNLPMADSLLAGATTDNESKGWGEVTGSRAVQRDEFGIDQLVTRVSLYAHSELLAMSQVCEV